MRALGKLRENWRLGQGPQTLKEMRLAKHEELEAQRRKQALEEQAGLTFKDFWQDTYFPRTKLHKSVHSVDTEDMFFRV